MKIKNSIITIGTFDGVHKGHQFLIGRAVEIAKEKKLKCILIALQRPMRNVPGLLSTKEEKLENLFLLGVDEIILIEPGSEIFKNSCKEFYNNYLKKQLHMAHLVCGKNFAFGKNREGNIKWLKKITKDDGISLTIVKPVRRCFFKISSSKIRKYIQCGKIEKANKMLGKNYGFYGMPFKERGIGTKLGFPTVNIKIPKEKLLPKGVYVSVISQGINLFGAITSIGNRPTFNEKTGVVSETHILNFKSKWKKEKTQISLLKKIRNEKKFASTKELVKQIAKDVKIAKRYFKIS